MNNIVPVLLFSLVTLALGVRGFCTSGWSEALGSVMVIGFVGIGVSFVLYQSAYVLYQGYLVRRAEIMLAVYLKLQPQG